MQTKSKSGIFKPKTFLSLVSFLDEVRPLPQLLKVPNELLL